MTHVGYLIAGWGVSLGVLALYTRSILARGRALSAGIPTHRRRWINSDAEAAVPAGADRANPESNQ